MKLSKMKRRLTGLSVIAVMGVSLFSAGADVLTVKAAEVVTPEEAVTATEAATTDEATETEVAEETRVEAGTEVDINETNFPDSNFREYVKQFDRDNNGIFTSEELQAVTKIDVMFDGITNLKGVEYFTALTELNCGWNKLTSLDVSRNTALTYLYCNDNQLKSLDVSNNTALTELDCGSKERGWNELTSLDVSKNTALTELNCGYNQLTSLDVTKNIALTQLGCYENQLTSLDVSNNTALKSLYCSDNQLTSLDVSNNTALTSLYCSDNQLTSLDVSNNTALTSLYCNDNQLTSLDVSNNTALTLLHCYNNKLTSLDVSKSTALTGLGCYNNKLTSLDVSNNTALTGLYCYNNKLTSLDISKNKELTELSCDSDALSSVDACKDIKRIYLYAPLYKKGNSYYFDLSKSLLDKTKISSPEIGTYDGASGHLTVPEDMSVKDEWGYYKVNRIVYDFGSEKKEIPLYISEVTNMDSYAEYQGYSFYEDEYGDKYCLDGNGNRVINEFKCDGTYTYYFQADGTAMMDRLTYHPDGVHVIYFDEEGHEVFSNFHKVKTTIEGNAVDDLCFFDVYGYLYVDVMTYGNAAFGNGDKIYYINPYGVIERNGWFGFSETCVWAGTDKKVGTGIGYANADGSLMINQHTYYNGNLVYMQGDGHIQ